MVADVQQLHTGPEGHKRNLGSVRLDASLNSFDTVVFSVGSVPNGIEMRRGESQRAEPKPREDMMNNHSR